MNLIIDVGNTRVKSAVFKRSEIIHYEIFSNEKLVDKVIEIKEKFKCTNAIISSVSNLKKNQISKIKSEINLFILNSNTKIPFKNKYSSPKTLGVDRIALAASAVYNYPKKNILVIDAGTCITYDFIDEKSNYFGGAIAPGISMRYKSLNYFTENLPLLSPKYVSNLIGNDTNSSIHIGVVTGVINEIDSFIDEYRKKNKDLTIVLTGGDSNFLNNRLKNGIFANPNFLLEGLNIILTYNL
jgi:type III pantothenate kinase